jgi:hypothetical protein
MALGCRRFGAVVIDPERSLSANFVVMHKAVFIEQRGRV